jgi:hypothetical protein
LAALSEARRRHGDAGTDPSTRAISSAMPASGNQARGLAAPSGGGNDAPATVLRLGPWREQLPPRQDVAYRETERATAACTPRRCDFS